MFSLLQVALWLFAVGVYVQSSEIQKLTEECKTAFTMISSLDASYNARTDQLPFGLNGAGFDVAEFERAKKKATDIVGPEKVNSGRIRWTEGLVNWRIDDSTVVASVLVNNEGSAIKEVRKLIVDEAVLVTAGRVVNFSNQRKLGNLSGFRSIKLPGAGTFVATSRPNPNPDSDVPYRRFTALHPADFFNVDGFLVHDFLGLAGDPSLMLRIAMKTELRDASKGDIEEFKLMAERKLESTILKLDDSGSSVNLNVVYKRNSHDLLFDRKVVSGKSVLLIRSSKAFRDGVLRIEKAFDWKEVDGIWVPVAINHRSENPKGWYSIRLDNIKVNSKLDSNIFDYRQLPYGDLDRLHLTEEQKLLVYSNGKLKNIDDYDKIGRSSKVLYWFATLIFGALVVGWLRFLRKSKR
jgi:hypothetical protein